jgi:uncharacterized SAM-binding protein YcdF (DUF218 family)
LHTSLRRFPLPTALLFLVLIALAWWGFVSLGHVLHREDPLAQADVIFVLGGSRLDRVAEAGDLFREGWAPKILLSRQMLEGAEIVLRQRGLHVPTETDNHRLVLGQMGVPPQAIEETVEQLTTASESVQLRALAQANRWSRVIVVTSRLHTARARLTMRRRLDDIGVRVIMRATRYDQTNLDRWWASRADFRFGLLEAQKMLVYWIGIAD